MEPNDPFVASIPSPTAARPLLGLTVLVVEDSRYACEAIRLVCLRSGARIRRADCLRSARRHLQVYRPSVVVVDLGLPDGSGLDLIRDLAESTPRMEAVLAISGDPGQGQTALDAGAQGFMPKPITSIAAFQEAIIALLPADRRPPGPRLMNDEHIVPDRIAYLDDMAHVAEMLDDHRDGHALDYAAQFLSGLALSADDTPLAQAAAALSGRRASGATAGSEAAALAGLVQERLAQKIAI